MPELPEAEVVVRQLQARLLGAVVKDCWLSRPDIVRQGLDSFDWYRGARIEQIVRYGKAAILELSRGPETRYLAVRFGMTGLLFFRSFDPSYDKHTHMIVSLNGGKEPELRYWDPRRFGGIYFLDQAGLQEFMKVPDALEITSHQFVTLMEQRQRRLKGLLMDSHFIAGIGNIYANEILYRARLHPSVKSVSRESAQRLYKAMKDILEEAIACGGSTISDFRAPDGTQGQYQYKHKVYDRKGKRCPARCGEVIQQLKNKWKSARSSFYCRTCQRRRS